MLIIRWAKERHWIKNKRNWQCKHMIDYSIFYLKTLKCFFFLIRRKWNCKGKIFKLKGNYLTEERSYICLFVFLCFDLFLDINKFS